MNTKRWKYHTYTSYGSNDNTEELNSLGLTGWELVSAYITNNNIHVYVFKKPIM